ncbi:roadblock/LC7 domain-containing protein [Methylomonas sp. EFPC1]|uniref:Roadblock/LC7 domain-containing protein n=1 Tax=Methylomonas defluvii TaxID=3045149 RepID=A0ABU4UJP4_9GAMM|nr:MULTISPECIES: roadblock/LC7 domain-containing protein [unclassified Methylomonas]MDX8129371.1 roadblock/LC7 domain-containing protein [Methylomonas sp. OY6]QSB00027.1 roadblock/LC7 domain-containing protein [Methylomonas sp. EFPC1]
MHWFESQLAQLDTLADDYLTARRQPAADIVNVSEATRLKRAAFIDAVQSVVDKVVKINGVSACAAYHDGLILAQSAEAPNMDAFGAIIQETIRAAQHGETSLGLGEIEQIVIVGAVNKLAMLSVGPIILCISSPKGVNLASVLSQAK